MERLETLSPQLVYEALETSPEGLTSQEAERRLAQYGPNILREAPRKPIIFSLLANFTHLMALLLWAASGMAFVARMPQLGIAVIGVIVINALFSFWQEYRAERAIEALRKLLPAHARVVRDGAECRLLADELVPGDLVLLSEGELISADARLVEEFELRTNNATLTGESMPVRRSAEPVLRDDIGRTEITNMVFAGTSVATGTGRAVVSATGMRTELGRITDLTQTVQEETSPIQVEVARAVRWVTITAVVLGVLFFAIGALVAGMQAAEAFIFGVGIIVAFVPEGMLPTVTLSLAMGVQRMARRNALVKRLSAVETLGCTTVICTDKTGTLTQNEMTVLRLWAGGQEFQASGYGYRPEGKLVTADGRVGTCDEPDLVLLLTAAALCNNARLLPPEGDGGRWSILGDPTEAALLVASAKCGLEFDALARAQPRLREYPFESRRKRMSTVHAQGQGEVAYVKGAPLEILSRCDAILVGGQQQPLTQEWRDRITAHNDAYAAQALRVLAAAYRPLHENEDHHTADADAIEQGLVFAGLLAMMDPPRPEVAHAVELCHRAQVRIIMITGDYGLTARSVATRLGIFSSDQGRVVTGVELGQMPEDSLLALLRSKDDVIFARVSPEDKLRVVSALKTLGEVVAVTGDGVNDAPALRRSDIGIAMGLSGTDVAKEASDMILTDDNFASIVNAIEEGRAVYANIRKFCTYIFASNVPEAVPFLFFVLSGGRIPLGLTIMQILAVDLGTDLVPALALGADLPEPGVMAVPPRAKTAHLVDLKLLARAYLWEGLLEGILAMAAFFWIYWSRGYAGVVSPLPGPEEDPLLYVTATTACLAAIVASQIGNVFGNRSEVLSIFHLGLFSNRLVLLGIAAELILILAIVYVPPFQAFFDTAPLRGVDWLLLCACPPFMLLAEEGRKWIVRRASRSRS